MIFNKKYKKEIEELKNQLEEERTAKERAIDEATKFAKIVIKLRNEINNKACDCSKKTTSQKKTPRKSTTKKD